MSSVEFDVKTLREELDLITRFHHENKANYEYLIKDDIPVDLGNETRSTSESQISEEDRKLDSLVNSWRGKQFAYYHKDISLNGKDFDETLEACNRKEEFAFKKRSTAHNINKQTNNQPDVDGSDVKELLTGLEGSVKDGSTSVKKLMWKGRGDNGLAISGKEDDEFGEVLVKSGERKYNERQKTSYFPEFDYSLLGNARGGKTSSRVDTVSYGVIITVHC